MRIIRKVAVLGSGIMGSRIACHCAGVGLEVLLLDVAASGATNVAGRNKVVNDSLALALKSSPSPVYEPSVAAHITTGNFDDDLPSVGSCDWIIEVIIEQLAPKMQLFERIERYRKAGAFVTSNTSGISLNRMLEGRSEDFKAHFCGTHFFNPPRYLRLLEIIPAAETLPEVTQFFLSFGDRFLGKKTVMCKDTPAFIANRIGVYGILSTFHLGVKFNLGVLEMDELTGPLLGRPKSATFRTADVVGLDTLVRVAQGVYDACPEDEERNTFLPPESLRRMIEHKWLGDKTGQGFYKKQKQDGETVILPLNLNTLEYSAQPRPRSTTLDAVKQLAQRGLSPAALLKESLKTFMNGRDETAEFIRELMYSLFAYCSHRIPEIADEVFRIDEAMKAGFGWELGPFELWDALGVKETAAAMVNSGKEPAAWVTKFIEHGFEAFYKTQGGKKWYYDIPKENFSELETNGIIFIDQLKQSKTVKSTSGWSLVDLGDGVLNLEFHTKMNTLDSGVIAGISGAIDLAEKQYRALVIGNQGANFSAGANVAELFMAASDGEWEELDLAVRRFQNTSMRIRYSAVPVVVAPHRLCLGGGCEISMHADHVQLDAETYMGLVEFGVGLIPGGGGTKEFTLRASDEYVEGEIEQVILRHRFLTIGMAKVSTSAIDAFHLGYLSKGKFSISINSDRVLFDAKQKAIELAERGYLPPIPRKDIKVLGRQGLGLIHMGANSMFAGHYISDYDRKMSEKLGWVMCGGDLSQPSRVSEQYLLDLEREAFLSLAGEKKTLERIQRIIKGGKPLRN